MVRAYNLDGGHRGYPFAVKAGKFHDAEFFSRRTPRQGSGFRRRAAGTDLRSRLPRAGDRGQRLRGRLRRRAEVFRFVAVDKETAYFQEPILPAAEIWVGNPLVAADKRVRLALVMDGQAGQAAPGRNPQPHRPGIETEITSPPHTPILGGLRTMVRLPAGDSRFFRIVGHEFRPEIARP